MMSNLFTHFLILPLTLWYIDRLAFTETKMCETEYCYDFANRIKLSMNDDVDPCTNFYEYACGSWKKSNPIPEGELQWTVDDLITERTMQKIRNIVESPDMPDDIDPVKKMKRFYRSCMDTERLEKRGIAPLVNIVESTGGWPMAMKDWDSSITPWQKVDTVYSNIDGRNAFFSVLYTHDDVNLTRYVLLIDEDVVYPLLRKNVDPVSDPSTTIQAFAEIIAKTVSAIVNYKNIVITKEQFSKDVLNVLQFEFALRDIGGQDKKKEKSGIEKMTIGSLQEWYDSLPHENATSHINWLELFQSSFGIINKTITPEEPIFVASKESLRKLSVLLDATPPRTIVNYIQWLFISHYIAYTTKNLREAKYAMYTAVFNMTFRVPRWKECIKQIGMQDAVSYAFVKKYFTERVKHAAEEMVERIKEEIASGIERTHWTNPSMKTHMIEKLDMLEEQIGYPEWYNDDKNIIEAYAELEIGDDLFENIINYGTFTVLTRLWQFYEPVDKETWLEYPTTINAFYSERDNIIVIPAAILQNPFFTPGLPDAINYGSIGFIIGHELSHGFDHIGMNYDKHGNKVTKSVQELLNIYEDKAKCFVKQFNEFAFNHTDENGNFILLNGNLTENENIADSTGIKLAYLAYKEKAKETICTSLPNLKKFNDEQLFFLAFATSWCTNMHPIYEKSSINLDVHSPANFRIIGSLANMNSFATAFDCPPGSPMNPVKKCTIWS